jgi:hypothetical protein
VETLLYLVYRLVLIPCSHLKDRQRFVKRDGCGAASVMTRHETNCEKQNIQEIKELDAKRGESDRPYQDGEAYNTKLTELVEVLNRTVAVLALFAVAAVYGPIVVGRRLCQWLFGRKRLWDERLSRLTRHETNRQNRKL